MTRIRTILLALAATTLTTGAAHAATNLVSNGDFETTLRPGESGGIGTWFNGSYVMQQATGWTTDGYDFLFTPGAADTTGAEGYYGNLKLYGPGTGDNNGFTLSPNGGNFIASDGGYRQDSIDQTITGLVVGRQYDVSFYWAAAQQAGYSGTQYDNWTVSLGNESYSTATIENASHGFTPWKAESFRFTATGATQVLSFLAHGEPSGVPPFALLDGVRMTAAVPEPATWGLMILGFGGIGVMVRRRRIAAIAA